MLLIVLVVAVVVLDVINYCSCCNGMCLFFFSERERERESNVTKSKQPINSFSEHEEFCYICFLQQPICCCSCCSCSCLLLLLPFWYFANFKHFLLLLVF